MDEYHIMGVDDGHNSPYTSPKHMSDGEEAEKVQDCWTEEMSCPKPKTDHRGRVTDYRRWYERNMHTYSNFEFIAPHIQTDCVHTVDCMPPDQDELELGNKDSLLEYDWEKYTSIEPNIYLELNKDEILGQ